MTKLLTTGEMIDRLNVGQVAESADGIKVKNINNRLFFVDENEDVKGVYGSNGIPILDGVFRMSKWRIQPNYVSFDEAMEALKNGRTVRCHPKWRDGISHEINPREAKQHAIEFLDIKGEGLMTIVFESKWTIEGDQ